MINQFTVGEELKSKIFLLLTKFIKIVKYLNLEQNYRSTKNILETASNLISNNSNRVGKNYGHQLTEGELVKLNCIEQVKMKHKL